MTPGEQTEQILQGCLSMRGWKAEKLDKRPPRSADFRVHRGDTAFYCEVKTVSSVRADFPLSALMFFKERQADLQEQIDRLATEYPGTKLILTPYEAEVVFSGADELESRFTRRRRNTEGEFTAFADRMRTHFQISAVRTFPYVLRLDSGNLYSPTRPEEENFFAWLERELVDIEAGEAGRRWSRSQSLEYLAYGTTYRIHAPAARYEVTSEYEILVLGPRRDYDGLIVDIHGYGGLNIQAVDGEVEDALGQLKASAERRQEESLARCVLVRFEGGLDPDHWDQLITYVSGLFETHRDLSALVVLDWAWEPANTTVPTQQDALTGLIEFALAAKCVPRFVVYHNTNRRGVAALPYEAFADPYSTEIHL